MNVKKRIAAAAAAVFIMTAFTGCKASDYKKAEQLFGEGSYSQAEEIYSALGDYKNCADMVTECKYQSAKQLCDNGSYDEAKTAFEAISGYKDSTDMISECSYLSAKKLFDSGSYKEARAAFTAIGGYKDSDSLACDAMWEMLCKQYPKSGGILRNDTKGNYLKILTSDDKDNILFQLNYYEGTHYQLNFSVDRGDKEGFLYGVAGDIAELAADIDLENHSGALDWRINSPYISDSTVSFLFNVFARDLGELIKTELSENGLGLTPEDIGIEKFLNIKVY